MEHEGNVFVNRPPMGERLKKLVGPRSSQKRFFPGAILSRSLVMRYALFSLAALIAGLAYLTLSGCSTDQPGTTDTLGTYSANVAAAPDKATEAAHKACNDLNLQNI